MLFYQDNFPIHKFGFTGFCFCAALHQVTLVYLATYGGFQVGFLFISMLDFFLFFFLVS